MTPLTLWSQPFGPSGGTSATGILNALGRPDMSLPTLLVRETIQNSWDARNPSREGPVLFDLSARHLTDHQATVLSQEIFSDLPLADQLGLEDALNQPEVPILTIADWGTVGLGGPTRAGIKTDDPNDFADFIRNVGLPPDKEHGAGTYGYGKAVLYLASKASTIIAYTRCRTSEGVESRLIGVGLDEPYTLGEEGQGQLFTGRHWWGTADDEAGIEPVKGDRADDLAEALGLERRGSDELGTTLAVVAPEFPDCALREAVEEMAEATLWYAWPKMLSSDTESHPEMSFSLQYENQEIPVDSPLDRTDVRGFVEAFRAASGSETSGVFAEEVIPIRCGRPKQHLGRMGIVKFLYEESTSGAAVAGRPFEGPPHHVALMRVPELVVTYQPAPESPVRETAWAGTFLADEEVDRAFADAEPPAHNEWTPDILPKSHGRTFVNVALRRIREKANLFVDPPRSGTEEEGAIPLAGIAGALGGLLAGDTGPGTSSLHSGGGTSNEEGEKEGNGGGGGRRTGPSSSSRASIEIGTRELVLEEGVRVLRVSFTLVPARDSSSSTVRAQPVVAVDDGTASERVEPVGAPTPEVLGWELNGDQSESGDSITVEGSEPAEGEVVISVPDDTSISVTLSAHSQA